MARQIEETLREVQRWDPSKHPGNEELMERIRTPGPAEHRATRASAPPQTGRQRRAGRSSAAERVPQGYGDAVAEYFRKLSKSK